jgi:hypothetical protein
MVENLEVGINIKEQFRPPMHSLGEFIRRNSWESFHEGVMKKGPELGRLIGFFNSHLVAISNNDSTDNYSHFKKSFYGEDYVLGREIDGHLHNLFCAKCLESGISRRNSSKRGELSEAEIYYGNLVSGIYRALKKFNSGIPWLVSEEEREITSDFLSRLNSPPSTYY